MVSTYIDLVTQDPSIRLITQLLPNGTHNTLPLEYWEKLGPALGIRFNVFPLESTYTESLLKSFDQLVDNLNEVCPVEFVGGNNV
jgi:hypothetical protein